MSTWAVLVCRPMTVPTNSHCSDPQLYPTPTEDSAGGMGGHICCALLLRPKREVTALPNREKSIRQDTEDTVHTPTLWPRPKNLQKVPLCEKGCSPAVLWSSSTKSCSWYSPRASTPVLGSSHRAKSLRRQMQPASQHTQTHTHTAVFLSLDAQCATRPVRL
jgi:hypothetical protein